MRFVSLWCWVLLWRVTEVAGALGDEGGQQQPQQQQQQQATGDHHLRGSWSRRLSAATDLFTGETIKTFNGQVPRTSCEAGYYRQPGGSNLKAVSGLRLDGCILCPRGTYGAVPGLTDRTCSGSCPAGKYSATVGITAVSACTDCPPGRYGSATGLTSALCTDACPPGKTSEPGAKDVAACVACLVGEQNSPCTWPLLPRRDRRTGTISNFP